MLYVMCWRCWRQAGLNIPARWAPTGWLYGLAGVVPLIPCAGLVLGHRKLTALSRGQIAATFAIHFRALVGAGGGVRLWELSGRCPRRWPVCIPWRCGWW